jgi:hypothetical protein
MKRNWVLLAVLAVSRRFLLAWGFLIGDGIITRAAPRLATANAAGAEPAAPEETVLLDRLDSILAAGRSEAAAASHESTEQRGKCPLIES